MEGVPYRIDKRRGPPETRLLREAGFLFSRRASVLPPEEPRVLRRVVAEVEVRRLHPPLTLHPRLQRHLEDAAASPGGRQGRDRPGVDSISYTIYNRHRGSRSKGRVRAKTEHGEEGVRERRPVAWLHGEINTPPFTEEGRKEAGDLLRLLQ